MKLYEVPRNTRIVLSGESGPIELHFDRIDGMYSRCTDDRGNVWHIAAWEEVEIKEVAHE